MAEKQYLDTAGLDLVLHALENKFNTKQDTLVIYNAPDDENSIKIDDKIILNHINIQKNSTGIIVEAEEVATYNMVNKGASDDFAAVYEFQKITDGHIENICEINIPKDCVIPISVRIRIYVIGFEALQTVSDTESLRKHLIGNPIELTISI